MKKHVAISQGYLNGLFDMALEMREHPNPSSTNIKCFESYDQFNQYYKNRISIKESEDDLFSILKDWFYLDQQIARKLSETIEESYQPVSLYRLDKDNNIDIEKILNMFFSIDDVFFMETQDLFIVLVMGNFE